MNDKLEKAQFFIAKGAFSKARSLLLSVVKQNKNKPQGFVLLGKISLQSGEVEQAAAYFQTGA